MPSSRTALSIIILILLTACQSVVGYHELNIPIEIADTEEERTQGLMDRESLEGGMLFIFEEENYLNFWMKNTLIPLDIIFLDKNYKILNIQNAVPCKEEPCELYPSAGKAKYVLEVNAGFAQEENLIVGEKLVLEI